MIHPVSMRQQRNARLSLHNGRKKSQDVTNDLSPVNGHAEEQPIKEAPNYHQHKRSLSKTASTKKESRNPSLDTGRPVDVAGSNPRRTSSLAYLQKPAEPYMQVVPSNSSSGRPSTEEDSQAPIQKMGSVRKRLSLLKIGKKSSKPGLMGSLDEE